MAGFVARKLVTAAALVELGLLIIGDVTDLRAVSPSCLSHFRLVYP